MTIAGTFACVTSSPLSAPSSAPRTMPAMKTTTMGSPGLAANRKPVAKAVHPRMEPTERSTPSDWMMRDCPAAISMAIVALRKRSRTPWAERKRGFITHVNRTRAMRAAITGSSRIDSRERSFDAGCALVTDEELAGSRLTGAEPWMLEGGVSVVVMMRPFRGRLPPS